MIAGQVSQGSAVNINTRHCGAMSETRIQDDYPKEYHGCFGCGRDNPRGMGLGSYWDGEDVVMDWTPEPTYQARRNVLHGGMTALLIDEVAAAAAMAHAHRAAGVALGARPVIEMVTVNMNVDYLASVPIDRPVHIRVSLTDYDGRKMRLRSALYSGDVLAARATSLFLRLPQNGA